MHWFTKRPPCWFVSFILPSSTIQVRWWTGLIRDVILMLRSEKYLYLYFSESTATTRKRVSIIGLGRHTKTLWCSLSTYESFSNVGESWVWWRADFQSGSRVLKNVFWTFSYLSLYKRYGMEYGSGFVQSFTVFLNFLSDPNMFVT